MRWRAVECSLLPLWTSVFSPVNWAGRLDQMASVVHPCSCLLCLSYGHGPCLLRAWGWGQADPRWPGKDQHCQPRRAKRKPYRTWVPWLSFDRKGISLVACLPSSPRVEEADGNFKEEVKFQTQWQSGVKSPRMSLYLPILQGFLSIVVWL